MPQPPVVVIRCSFCLSEDCLGLPCIERTNCLIRYCSAVCRARVDLAFIIDGSGSIESSGKGNFRRCLNFVRAVVSQFNMRGGQSRFAAVVFSSKPRLIFGFTRYRRKAQILNAINRIRYPRGGTKTGWAMRYTYSRVLRQARRGVRKVGGTKTFYVIFLLVSRDRDFSRSADLCPCSNYARPCKGRLVKNQRFRQPFVKKAPSILSSKA